MTEPRARPEKLRGDRWVAHRRGHVIRAIATLGLLLTLGSCDSLPFGYVDIGDITRDPARYEGQSVKLKGRVKSVVKIPLLGITIYLLRDESGEIYVIPRETLPSVDARVSVRGVVDSMVVLPGFTAGTRIRETSRW